MLEIYVVKFIGAQVVFRSVYYELHGAIIMLGKFTVKFIRTRNLCCKVCRAKGMLALIM